MTLNVVYVMALLIITANKFLLENSELIKSFGILINILFYILGTQHLVVVQ